MCSSPVSSKGTLALRPLCGEDADRILLWRNQTWIRDQMIDPHEIGLEEHAAWIQRVLGEHTVTVLVCEIDGSPGGIVQFTDIDQVNAHARWGFYLGAQTFPRGTGSRMGRLALRYAFDELHLHRVYADVLASNIASLRMHQKLSFREEGRLREHLFRSGAYVDVILLGILADEWAACESCDEDQPYRS